MVLCRVSQATHIVPPPWVDRPRLAALMLPRYNYFLRRNGNERRDVAATTPATCLLLHPLTASEQVWCGRSHVHVPVGRRHCATSIIDSNGTRPSPQKRTS